jgi:hypothetical protein
MLVAAACCVGFAVFMMLDAQTPAQARVETLPASVTPVLAAAEIAEPVTVLEPVFEPALEPVSWIQIIPPEEIYEMYEMYVFIPEAYLDAPADIEVAAEIPVPAPVETPVITTPASPIPVQYTLLPFYIHENSTIYAEFLRERPYLDVETVIWKVNASVHVPFYSVVRVNNQPNPLFITPTYRLPYGFNPPELVPVNHENCTLRAAPQAVDAFHSLREHAREHGFDLAVTSAFRSAERQSQLWINGGRRDGRVARPHHSEHQTGRALDLWGPGGLLDSAGPSPTGLWVAAHVHYHGFIIRYRAETTHITGHIPSPWHITYLTRALSMYMHENNIISLEEFVGRNPGAGMFT